MFLLKKSNLLFENYINARSIMKLKEAIRKRRSIREYKDKQLPYKILKEIVQTARIAPSAANIQPLEYLIVDSTELEKKLFNYTHWAGYLDWNPPKEARPRAYILVLVDKEKMTESYKYDVGAAAENMCLTALENDLGTCILGAIDRKPIRELLNIPDKKKLDVAIAIGYPDQNSTIEEAEDGNIRYNRDAKGHFHVPKRKLENILHHNRF